MPENHDQMKEIREILAHKRVLLSNEGYSESDTLSVSNIVRSIERSILEEVDTPTAPTSILEQLIKQFNEYKKLSIAEFVAGTTKQEAFAENQITYQEAMNYLYDIISARYKYAQLEPGKWSELIVSYEIGNNTRTEKERLEILRNVIEKRWKADEKLIEFDGFLRLKKLMEDN